MKHAGIDVGKSTLHLAIHGCKGCKVFKNTVKGRQALMASLKDHFPVRVVVEPTAKYHLAIARDIALSEGGEVVVANPRATANFAKALDQRGKSDSKDCHVLAAFSAGMSLITWTPPSESVEHLRVVTRRRWQLVQARTEEKVRLKEEHSTTKSPFVIEDIESHITFLDAQISRHEKMAVDLAKKDPKLARWTQMLTSIPGIGAVLAAVLTAELIHLPIDITPRQLTAFAGLDPRENQSGSRDGRRSISRRGNKRIRTALYIAASVASQHSPHVKAWKEERVRRGKSKKLVNVAVARKFLHVIAALRDTGGSWDGQKFHRIPDGGAA